MTTSAPINPSGKVTNAQPGPTPGTLPVMATSTPGIPVPVPGIPVNAIPVIPAQVPVQVQQPTVPTVPVLLAMPSSSIPIIPDEIQPNQHTFSAPWVSNGTIPDWVPTVQELRQQTEKLQSMLNRLQDWDDTVRKEQRGRVGNKLP